MKRSLNEIKARNEELLKIERSTRGLYEIARHLEMIILDQVCEECFTRTGCQKDFERVLKKKDFMMAGYKF